VSKRHRVTVPRWTWVEGPSPTTTVDSEDGQGEQMSEPTKISLKMGPRGFGKLYINGVEVSKSVAGVHIRAIASRLTQVTFEVYNADVEYEGPAEVTIGWAQPKPDGG
jgi:hypothetical protein